MSQSGFEEDLLPHEAMELSDLQATSSAVELPYSDSDTAHEQPVSGGGGAGEQQINPTTEHKPLKAVMRRSNSGTNLSSSHHHLGGGSSHHGGIQSGVIFSNTGISEHAKQQRIEKERHQQMENMQRQMELLEQKNLENIKQRRKLTADLESKMRECKFYEKQVIDMTNENQQLKAQLESTLRVSSGVIGTNTSVVGTLSGTKRTGGLENNASHGNKQGGGGGGGGNAKEALILQELRTCREKLSTMETENKTYKLTNNELTMQVKILQDALNFRSEEIGLSGHADLLTKVAKLKGEVTALKHELTNKVEELNTIKEDKNQLDSERHDLQEQIALIQQRLAQAQQETYRYSNQDTVELLKSVEQERDVLIEFIQSDMQKSATLAKQVETLESELRIAKKKNANLEEKWKEREDSWKELKDKLHTIEKESCSMREQLNQQQRALEQMKIDRDSLQHQLDRKMLEEEELIKAQVTLFAQLKSKDEELLQKSEDCVLLKMKLQEYELAKPSIQDEISTLRGRNQSMEKEIHRLRHIIHELEPKVKSLEPMIPRLEKEMEEYRQYKVNMTLECQELKRYRQLVEDLHQDFDAIDERERDRGRERDSMEMGTTTSTSGNGRNKGGNKSTTNVSPFSPSGKSVSWVSPPTSSTTSTTATASASVINPSLSLSQQHSMWIGLPSLRNVSPILYEKIRNLANDLHHKETESNELRQSLVKLNVDYEELMRERENLQEQSQLQRQQDHEQMLTMKEKLYVIENEMMRLREAQHIIQQIKLVLLAYPGQKPFTLRTRGEKGEKDHESEGEREAMKENSLCLDDSLILNHHLSASTPSKHNHQDDTVDTSQISDIALPDLINQTLLTNAQAVLTVRETNEHNLHLQHDNEELKSKWQETEQRNIELENQIVDLKEKLSLKERRLNDLDYDFQSHMNDAAELAEKQNALMMTLEAKVEGMQRDRQLRIAQIQALQQREESMKQRVIAHCDYQRLYLPPQLTNSSAASSTNHLAELIGYILDNYLSSGSNAAVASSAYHPSQAIGRSSLSASSSGNPFNRQSSHQPAMMMPADHRLSQPSSSGNLGMSGMNHHYSQQQSDLLPTRHRSSSPVLPQPPSQSQQLQSQVQPQPRMPYERESSFVSNNDELLRPISTRVSPLKSARSITTTSDSFEMTQMRGSSGNRLDQSRGVSLSHDSLASSQRGVGVGAGAGAGGGMRSSADTYMSQPQQLQSQVGISNGELQDRLRRTRMSFSSMKEM